MIGLQAGSQPVFSGKPEGPFCLSCTFIFRNERSWIKESVKVSEKLVNTGLSGLQVATCLGLMLVKCSISGHELERYTPDYPGENTPFEFRSVLRGGQLACDVSVGQRLEISWLRDWVTCTKAWYCSSPHKHQNTTTKWISLVYFRIITRWRLLGCPSLIHTFLLLRMSTVATIQVATRLRHPIENQFSDYNKSNK